MKKGLILFACILMTACTSPLVWTKAGTDANQVQRDKEDCIHTAKPPKRLVTEHARAWMENEAIPSCMEAKGYIAAPKGSGS